MGRDYSERRWRSHVTIEVSTEMPRAVAEREAKKGLKASNKKKAPSGQGKE
jgi:hypothetical protein